MASSAIDQEHFLKKLSAKIGLSASSLVAEMENLISNPNAKAVGTVIESNINPTEGALATVLIQNGTLSKGSVVIVGETYGTIKAIKNYAGETIDEALPSTPARVLGLNKVPAVGDILREVEDLSEVKELLTQQKQSRCKFWEAALALLMNQMWRWLWIPAL